MTASLSPEPEETAGAAALSPLARLQLLCDPGSLRIEPSAVTPLDREPLGVLAAVGTVAGRRIACFAQDGSVSGGAVGEAQADAIVGVLRRAEHERLPVVGFVHSAGARIQEGVGGLASFARIFAVQTALLGRVPQVAVVTGPCAGGGAYTTALGDFTVMTEAAAMFLTGPGVVLRALGERVTAEELGGPRVHGRNGVSHLVASDDCEAVELARSLLSYVGGGVGARTLLSAARLGDPAACLPERRSAGYDVHGVIRRIVDPHELLELWPRWATNMVTAFGRIGGHPVGIVANQPARMGGAIDADASEKASRFVRACDAYGVPLVVLVDTPGFMPGARQEQAAIIFRGARVVEAFAGARVARFTVVLRKAFGGAYIAMNAKHLGATRTFAWPQAEIAIMDPQQAMRVVHHRELERVDEPDTLAAALAHDYAEAHCRAVAAVRAGFVDELLEPADTRARLWSALADER